MKEVGTVRSEKSFVKVFFYREFETWDPLVEREQYKIISCRLERIACA